MASRADQGTSFTGWAQEGKWVGQFSVKWIFVKDIPNKEFRDIKLE